MANMLRLSFAGIRDDVDTFDIDLEEYFDLKYVPWTFFGARYRNHRKLNFKYFFVQNFDSPFFPSFFSTGSFPARMEDVFDMNPTKLIRFSESTLKKELFDEPDWYLPLSGWERMTLEGPFAGLTFERHWNEFEEIDMGLQELVFYPHLLRETGYESGEFYHFAKVELKAVPEERDIFEERKGELMFKVTKIEFCVRKIEAFDVPESSINAAGRYVNQLEWPDKFGRCGRCGRIGMKGHHCDFCFNNQLGNIIFK